MTRTSAPSSRRRLAAVVLAATAAALALVPTAAPARAATAPPASCWDVKTADPDAGPGPHMLLADGVWVRVLCADMEQVEGGPFEYLVLPTQGAGSNFGQVRDEAGTLVRATYTAARLYLPGWLGEGFRLNTWDARHASTDVAFGHLVPLGSAAECTEAGAPTSANLDLRGTPFSADARRWDLFGGGQVTASADGKVVDVTGATGCTWSGPPSLLELAVDDVAPSFVADPADQTVFLGQEARLEVTVAGSPRPTVQWQSWTPSGGWVDLTGRTGAVLTLTGLTLADDQLTVRAVATSTVGTRQSVPAVLTVREPAFDDVPVDQAFFADIQWLHDQGLARGTQVGDRLEFRPSASTSRQAMASFLYSYAGDGWTPAPGTHTFTDVPEGHPFHVAVEWMAATGLAGGYADGSFGATRPVSRQAMAAFLHRLEAASAPTALSTTAGVEPGPFLDVPADHAFAEEIAWLAQTKVTTGYDDGTFRPGAPITRQAMAAFLHRYDSWAG